MPPRNNELPEGTDHIIVGAMETGEGVSASTGSGGGTGDAGGGSSSGFIGSAAGTGADLDASSTGPGASGIDTGGGAGSGSDTSGGGKVMDSLKGGASDLRGQATERVRGFAQEGKARATDALEELSRVVAEAADSINDRVGPEYGQYARRAADAVSDLADSLRRKEVDELYDDARNIVRKSPAVAIGTAAALGFALVRLVKAGTEQAGQGGTRRSQSSDDELIASPGAGAAGTTAAPVKGEPRLGSTSGADV